MAACNWAAPAVLPSPTQGLTGLVETFGGASGALRPRMPPPRQRTASGQAWPAPIWSGSGSLHHTCTTARISIHRQPYVSSDPVGGPGAKGCLHTTPLHSPIASQVLRHVVQQPVHPCGAGIVAQLGQAPKHIGSAPRLQVLHAPAVCQLLHDLRTACVHVPSRTAALATYKLAGYKRCAWLAAGSIALPPSLLR